MRLIKHLTILLLMLTTVGCDTDMRLSSIVQFQHRNPIIGQWLKAPKQYFLEAHVRFDADLDKSVIFGIDQELIEGTTNPIYISGGDWMGLVGVQREGRVWVATGSASTMQGKPSNDRHWVYLDLKRPLKPDTWYRFSSIVNYETRHFVSFTIEEINSGSGTDDAQTFDLSAYTLDYPNMLPFDGRTMTTLVWAIGGKGLGGTQDSLAKVYFDDVRSGLASQSPDGKWLKQPLTFENFENGTKAFAPQPWSYMGVMLDKVIPLEKYSDATWYLERSMALAKPSRVTFAYSGNTVAEIDATLKNIPYDAWLGQQPK